MTGQSKLSRRCIALYSGGLDSILSIKLLQEQGIDVVALYFATPFFGFHALQDPEKFKAYHKHLYGINIEIIDHTDAFIPVLARPIHGYGKHLNPCIDCKISMLRAAKSLLSEKESSFVITGEVLGQRPMSQRRDTMNVIEKSSDLKDLLVRPLCAQLFPPSLPERDGVIDRERLLSISGRGRKAQAALAQHFGITDIPTPAGGCLLTYERTAQRISHTLKRLEPMLPGRHDLELTLFGRHFLLDDSTVLIVGRDERENDDIEKLTHSGNYFMKIADSTGPLCIIRGDFKPSNLQLAAGICLRYSKARGSNNRYALCGENPACMENSIIAPVLNEDTIRALLVDEKILFDKQ